MTHIHSTLSSIIQSANLTAYLLDASGVLYNDAGPTPHIASTIKRLQDIGEVMIVTNNSYLYIDDIQAKLKGIGITIPKTHIISSGLGLMLDPTIAPLIHNQNVYVYGHPKTHPYVQLAKPKHIAPTIQTADVLVLMGTFKPNAVDPEFEDILTHLNAHPTMPVICANPDQIIRSQNGTTRVVGYLAKRIETELDHPVHWMGKPYSNFSAVVKHITHSLNIPLSKRVGFFDDNPDNVRRLQDDLNITGVTILDTGISYELDVQHLSPAQTSDFYLTQLTF